MSTNHYGASDLPAQVAAALERASLGSGHLAWQSLAPLDQFHVGGLEATASLALRLAIPAGAKVLDVGSGLGGPARYLAANFDCDVIGVDLSQPFVDVATMLSERAGLSAKTRFHQGDASRLNFDSRSFDVVWTQHVVMNIADRDTLYAQIHDVLRPGGRFAMYDAIAGEGGPVLYPVPWARDASTSFMLSAAETMAELQAAGFVVKEWRDTSDAGLDWQSANIQAGASRSDRLRQLALPLAMGTDFPGMAANFERNLRSRRVRLVQIIAERPSPPA